MAAMRSCESATRRPSKSLCCSVNRLGDEPKYVATGMRTSRSRSVSSIAFNVVISNYREPIDTGSLLLRLICELVLPTYATTVIDSPIRESAAYRRVPSSALLDAAMQSHERSTTQSL